jgi:hypothetical protein
MSCTGTLVFITWLMRDMLPVRNVMPLHYMIMGLRNHANAVSFLSTRINDD